MLQAEPVVWTDRMLECLLRGGPEGGRWYSLFDKVWSRSTLRAGFARVLANGGAPGVDGMTVERFEDRLEEEIDRLHTALRDGSYRPQAVRRAWIPKPGTDEQRPLGIPTVRDRTVQTALKLVLEPIFEMGFSDHSHGFRPGRTAHDALGLVVRHLNGGRTWVVDADLKGYFDSIPHERLLAAVERKVSDRSILGLLRRFLEAGILDGPTLSEPDAGTPQGGVISPLLANLYLDELDQQMAQAGLVMERYADDFVILCRTQAEADQALARLQAWTAHAGLTLHPTKTRVVDLTEHGAHIDFLGFRFQRHRGRDGRDRILRLVRPKSLDRIKDTIRAKIPRKMATSQAETIRDLNRTLRGWVGYFRSACSSIHRSLDQLIRRRLRRQLCKAHGMSCWGDGIANLRWPNAIFNGMGLVSLVEFHRRHLQSRPGPTTNRRAVCGKPARTVRREGCHG